MITWVIDENKNEERIAIDGIDDIHNFADQNCHCSAL